LLRRHFIFSRKKLKKNFFYRGGGGGYRAYELPYYFSSEARRRF
jgi:hypothetical protein